MERARRMAKHGVVRKRKRFPIKAILFSVLAITLAISMLPIGPVNAYFSSVVAGWFNPGPEPESDSKPKPDVSWTALLNGPVEVTSDVYPNPFCLWRDADGEMFRWGALYFAEGWTDVKALEALAEELREDNGWASLDGKVYKLPDGFQTNRIKMALELCDTPNMERFVKTLLDEMVKIDPAFDPDSNAWGREWNGMPSKKNAPSYRLIGMATLDILNELKKNHIQSQEVYYYYATLGYSSLMNSKSFGSFSAGERIAHAYRCHQLYDYLGYVLNGETGEEAIVFQNRMYFVSCAFALLAYDELRAQRFQRSDDLEYCSSVWYYYLTLLIRLETRLGGGYYELYQTSYKEVWTTLLTIRLENGGEQTALDKRDLCYTLDQLDKDLYDVYPKTREDAEKRKAAEGEAVNGKEKGGLDDARDDR